MIQPAHLRRLVVLGVGFAGIAAALGARLVFLQWEQHEHYSRVARTNLIQILTREPPRGAILDARGNVLARSERVLRVFANPQLIGPHAAAVARAVAPVLGREESRLAQCLQPRISTNAQGRLVTNAYVNLKCQLDPARWPLVTQAVAALPLEPPGRKLTAAEKVFLTGLRRRALYPMEGQRRVYASGTHAAHLLGFAQEEEHEFAGRPVFELVGRDGVEWWFNAQLTGARGWRVTKKVRGVELVSYREQDVAARPGLNVVLALDLVVQQIVEAVLAEAMQTHTPVSASAVVVRPRTGDVLALAALPAYDPNRPGDAPADHRRNRIISDIFEPGSTFKIVTVSGALNEGLVSLQDRFYCEKGVFHYLGRVLRDHERYEWLTVAEILAKSSNIGAAKIGLKMGETRLDDYVRRFGFGAPTGVTLPGEVRGLAHPVARWDKLMITRVPIGQAVSVTSLQMVLAMAALANEGRLMSPRLVLRLEDANGRAVFEYPPQMVRRVVSPAVAREMVAALKLAVARGGTGFKADLDHYTVAGKTGTAQKPGPGGYQRGKYVASFVGFLPAEEPELCLGVFLDEPHNGYYGGQTAAPLFKKMAEQIAQYLSIRPDREENPGPTPALGALEARALADGVPD